MHGDCFLIPFTQSRHSSGWKKKNKSDIQLDKKSQCTPSDCMKQFLKNNWAIITSETSEVDLTFLFLRILSLFGCIAWYHLVPPSPLDKDILRTAFIWFSIYSTSCYLVIFLKPRWLRIVYLISLFLDLTFLTHIVRTQSYMDNSFFIGFYLLVSLHTIYFGLRFGLLVATLSTVLYMSSIYEQLNYFSWTEVALRVSFLYLIALPVGLLSEKIKDDKKTLEKLNQELAESLDNLHSTQEKLIEAEKFSALGRLTAYITHEIRNPLTALGGFARRLDKKLQNDSSEKEYVSVMIKEVARLEKILMDTLVYGKVTQTKLIRQNLNKPISDAISLYKEICSENNISLIEDLSPNLPDGKIDCGQLQQALDSLISNSIQAMPCGGTLSIHSGHIEKNNTRYLTITVRDTGGGIESENIDYIFEPFFSTKKIGVGTGLGLPIVKKIVDEHRGLIEVKNLPEQEMAIILYLPYQSEKEDQMTPCWEYLKCGVERDASRSCAAYPDFGRICWATAGSFSQASNHGICALKIENCRQCSFYKMINHFLPIHTET